MTSYQVALFAVNGLGGIISALLGYFVGIQRERRRWTRTVRHHLPGVDTVKIDDATGMQNGDIIVAFDSRTGKPRRRG